MQILHISFCLLVVESLANAAPFRGALGVLRSAQLRRLQGKQTIQKYRLWSPAEIKEGLEKWQSHYSDFIRVTTSQEAFGLPTAGTAKDCTFDDQVEGCLNYFYVIQDFETFPEGSEASKQLPEVLWSGELHGNEQVGPTSVLEATDLLLSAASCESLPRVKETDRDAYEKELAIAHTCREELADFGIDDTGRKWLARLVSTRRIVVVPTANALGYFRKKREEDSVDPNRDFPYDVKNPRNCMQTIAGRTLNEIFRLHLFQLSLTFHGGMEVVGYEWGAPSWSGHLSPDHTAQQQIGSAYSQFGGGFSSSPKYNSGTMNELVYPVTGGMEDWAYAGSWDPERVIPCDPKSYGGYPKEKTIYNNSTLRAFNMLVECSDTKIPKTNLGTSEGVLKSDAPGNGHISRNIRLALLAAELVEPYLIVTAVNGVSLTDDVVPGADHSDKQSCQKTWGVTVPPRTSAKTSQVDIEWTVGGALKVDDTQLWYAKWDDVPNFDCWSQPNAAEIESIFKVATQKSGTSGKGTHPTSSGSVFKSSIDVSPYSEGDRLVVVALATVDQDWATQPKNIAPDVPPQAHIVNARTNPDWYHEVEGSVIQGRLKWFSRPLTIEIGETKGAGASEINKRYAPLSPAPVPSGGSHVPVSPPAENGTGKGGKESGSMMTSILLVGVIAAVLFFVVRAVTRQQFRTVKRTRVMEFIEDEEAESPGLRDGGEPGYSDTGAEEITGHLELT